MSNTLDAASIGFGVQSSTIHLLAEEGIIPRFKEIRMFECPICGEVMLKNPDGSYCSCPKEDA